MVMIKNLSQILNDKQIEIDSINAQVQQSLQSIPMGNLQELELKVGILHAEVNLLVNFLEQIKMLNNKVLSEMRGLQADIIVAEIPDSESESVEFDLELIKTYKYTAGKFDAFNKVLELLS
jgi:hypothetical protein